MSLPPSILEENDQTRARREHLEAIRRLVGNAYPNKFARTNVTATPEGEDTITSIVAAFKRHEPQVAEGARPAPEQLDEANEALKGLAVRVSGRLATPPRVMGKAAFVHLSDGRERLQIYVRRQDARATNNDTGLPLEDPEGGWKLFQLLDHGDFVGVEGQLFITKTGELSVHVRELTFLAKALLPMPDKMHGISDPEIRQRQRYADLIASSLKVEREPGELTTREVFERRSRIITGMRRYLDAHGYVEVETPMLSPIASGAAARPFETFHNALGIKLYARIAPELYLKRLLVGGFERVYELNRNFRNEGVGYRWNPEFTMLEFYCAYMDVNGMMDFCEEMLRTTIEQVIGHTSPIRFRSYIDDYDLDFSKKFARLTMKEAIYKCIAEKYEQVMGRTFTLQMLDDPKCVRGLATAAPEVWGGPSQRAFDDAELIDFLRGAFEGKITTSHTPENTHDATGMAQAIEFIFGEVVEPKLIQPTFIHDYPKPISPLSKASPENPEVAERFELFCVGMEIANGFSELNDPVEQYERFRDQTKQRERGDEEAMQMDEDYVRALAYGMPPAAGIGIGVDRLTMLLTNKRTIREVILFPHMRPRAAAGESAGEAESPDES